MSKIYAKIPHMFQQSWCNNLFKQRAQGEMIECIKHLTHNLQKIKNYT